MKYPRILYCIEEIKTSLFTKLLSQFYLVQLFLLKDKIEVQKDYLDLVFFKITHRDAKKKILS